WFQSQDSGVTPNSSPSPTRRFRYCYRHLVLIWVQLLVSYTCSLTHRPAVSSTVRWPALTPLKRKGGVESDGPPKKLFVAGVTDPAHRSSYTVSLQPTLHQQEVSVLSPALCRSPLPPPSPLSAPISTLDTNPPCFPCTHPPPPQTPDP
ncbi:hypothetical protein INR49_030036, partial [Caranx melampygus]